MGTKNKKEVLIIFKTHLDIGFTDYAANVKARYINEFIPNAIRVGYELKDTDTPFIWTTGSWLIWEALKQDTDGKVAKAIEDGIICWHALPCTTHTELMTEKLFEYGLSLSKKMDERFNKHTIAAKMTDVPGHTMGMIPLMKKAGIEFLHIGVNPATPVPPVPPVFKWKCDDDEIPVMYQKNYGDRMELDNFVIYFAHTGDNNGPQSGEEIINLYDKAKSEYPDCDVKAATLNDVAVRLREIKNIPVVDKEIGDAWIHGAGTDPKKMGMYRELLRYIEDKDITDKDLSDNLLLIPEHTWGKNLQIHFPDMEHWTAKELEEIKDTPMRLNFEKSWQEQRDYVTAAAKELEYDLKYEVKEPDLAVFQETEIDESGIEISWQLFGQDDYTRYMKEYLRLDAANVIWASWDNLKIGLPVKNGKIFTAKTTACYKSGDKKLYKLEFDTDKAKEYELPYFWAEKNENKLCVSMFNKGASRLPQAMWLKFKGFDENWEVRKMGKWINPNDIIGSPLICAADYGVRNDKYEIKSLDAVLVAPFGRKLLCYGNVPENQDLYFNLYNNIWNTNFPMWYGDDTIYRFEIDIKK